MPGFCFQARTRSHTCITDSVLLLIHCMSPLKTLHCSMAQLPHPLLCHRVL